jgi:hypothetical protein
MIMERAILYGDAVIKDSFKHAVSHEDRTSESPRFQELVLFH